VVTHNGLKFQWRCKWVSSFPSITLSCIRSRGRFNHGEIKSRFNSRCACHHSVQNILCSRLISKNTRININRNTIFPWFLVNDHLDAQFFSMCLFQFSTCFEQPHVHHQENQLFQYNIWSISLCVGDRFVCRSERSFPTFPMNPLSVLPSYFCHIYLNIILSVFNRNLKWKNSKRTKTLLSEFSFTERSSFSRYRWSSSIRIWVVNSELYRLKWKIKIEGNNK
jgi:hypothetical protein